MSFIHSPRVSLAITSADRRLFGSNASPLTHTVDACDIGAASLSERLLRSLVEGLYDVTVTASSASGTHVTGKKEIAWLNLASRVGHDAHHRSCRQCTIDSTCRVQGPPDGDRVFSRRLALSEQRVVYSPAQEEHRIVETPGVGHDDDKLLLRVR